ncbi:MAG: biotin--[acetyl-CoA-carboxylase] ligase [Treponema sp.]|jgi:BirA family biotin operon repressor/biotin-[acetyl-CoA-carboxylase] ligase|nr:biotin--[acetyl-CoA-carboxylase] ligase [Treponema sp.]
MTKLSLANPFGGPIFHQETLSSTMDVSRELSDRGEPHGTVIAADFQEAGRGRLGRTWNSQRGESLFFTILLRYAGYAAIPKALTLKTGLAVALAIEDFIENTGLSLRDTIQVKWPNDIMIGPRKVAGILTEGNGKTVYAGIGVNLAQREFPEPLRGKAVSIALACNAGSADPVSENRFFLLERILAGLFRELTYPEDDRWRIRLLERLYMRDRTVGFIPGAADSPVRIEGRLHGIGPRGELLIVPEGETEPVFFVTGELDVYEK